MLTKILLGGAAALLVSGSALAQAVGPSSNLAGSIDATGRTARTSGAPDARARASGAEVSPDATATGAASEVTRTPNTDLPGAATSGSGSSSVGVIDPPLSARPNADVGAGVGTGSGVGAGGVGTGAGVGVGAGGSLGAGVRGGL